MPKATQEQLEYLDNLRESGETNMFGAPGYVVGRFGVTRHEAREIVQHWMDTFEERHPVDSTPGCDDDKYIANDDDEVVRELPEF